MQITHELEGHVKAEHESITLCHANLFAGEVYQLIACIRIDVTLVDESPESHCRYLERIAPALRNIYLCISHVIQFPHPTIVSTGC